MRDYLYALVGRCINLSLRIASLYKPKAKLLLDGRSKSLESLRASLVEGRPRIWFHAASLGEFEQGRPLMEVLRRRSPEWQIVLSFYSPSGYEVRHNYEGADAVVYLLGDTPREVRAFLDVLRPDKAVFIKYDFWAVHLSELARRGVETYLVSAIFRAEQLFFKPWGGLYRHLLTCFSHIYVQDQASVDLLASIGIGQVSIAGDTRFDRVETIAQTARSIAEIEAMKKDGSPLLVAGSTWAEDMHYLLGYAKHNPQIKMLIAPHELRESYCDTSWHPQAVRLSEVQSGARRIDDVRYLIIDCFGLLSSIYRYADVAYIGGGFGKGIHNTIEAAVYGVPVVFGAEYHKFREAHLLLASGAGFVVYDEVSLTHQLDELFADAHYRTEAGRKARSVVEAQLGATEQILADIL